MKSDRLFYEMFQAAPQIFFELLQITPACPYRFESVTVKSTEKRIDGLLKPERADESLYFLEIQGYPDSSIYWRVMREVATYFEQRPPLRNNEWQAVVLFLDSADDPGFGTLAALADVRLVAADLLTLLQAMDEESLAFNVLRPLLAESEAEVRQNVVGWAGRIARIPDLNDETRERLVIVLTQLIEEKFKTLGYREISQMLKLTPFEETTSFKEAMHQETLKLLLGVIEAKFVPAPETTQEINNSLKELDLKNLKVLFTEILKIETVEQLETWIDLHTPDTAPARSFDIL
jgi:predicted transposase/invertase (TIGR01784 family)